MKNEKKEKMKIIKNEKKEKMKIIKKIKYEVINQSETLVSNNDINKTGH